MSDIEAMRMSLGDAAQGEPLILWRNVQGKTSPSGMRAFIAHSDWFAKVDTTEESGKAFVAAQEHGQPLARKD